MGSFSFLGGLAGQYYLRVRLSGGHLNEKRQIFEAFSVTDT